MFWRFVASWRQVLLVNVPKEENINTFTYAYVKTYLRTEKNLTADCNQVVL
jgi:hypothetical protein